MRAIRVAWISDIVGSIGRSREEEIADDLPMLAESLGFELELVVSSMHMEDIGDRRVDLLVFDYGGASNSYGNFLWEQFELFIKWAQEHEGSLALLYSSMTGRMYNNLLKSGAQGDFRSENIMMWHTPQFGAGRKEVELQKRVKAWFIGGDFQPYEYPKPEPVALIPLPAPPKKPSPKKPKVQYTNKEIWDQAEKIKFNVEARVPRIECPDGGSQGFSVFKTFCTDVYDDDDKQIGIIGGGTGYVTINYKGKEWMIKHSDLWYAFIKAVEKGEVL